MAADHDQSRFRHADSYHECVPAGRQVGRPSRGHAQRPTAARGSRASLSVRTDGRRASSCGSDPNAQSRGATVDTFDLTGRRAVVTGASKNIGLAICRAFAAAGAELVMVARDATILANAAREIGPSASVRAVQADVTDPRSIDALVDSVRDHWPAGPDVLVNNAYALGPRSDVLGSSEQVWCDCWQANVLTPLRLCREFVPGMLAAGRGSIVNVVSGTGFQVAPGVAPYGTSKAAMWMLTRYLADECAPEVRCNALMPGMVNETPEEWEDDPTVRALIAATPLKRYGHPDEVAPAAVYLASDASSYTTGALLAVNGGRYWRPTPSRSTSIRASPG